MTIPIALSILAAALAAAALTVSLLRRKSPLGLNLFAELDVAHEKVKRLEAELEATRLELRQAQVKISPETLARYADQAIDYAEQVASDPKAKLSAALSALAIRDAGDNGKRDWTDAEHRIAIEAALARKNKK